MLKLSAWYFWRDGALWLSGELERRVPPLGERRGIIEHAAKTLGYPGGARLFEALRARYHWSGMKADCVEVAQALLPF